MALKPCRECGAQVSTTAKSCPHCGAKVRRIGLFGFVGLVLASAFSVALVVNAVQQRGAPAPTAEQLAERARSAATVAGARELRAMMHNPQRFELEKAISIGDASCYEFRAENAFGAMRAGQAVIIGGRISTSGTDGFEALWTRHCAGKSGQDHSAAAR